MRLDSYSYRLSDTVCELTLLRSEMEGSVHNGFSDEVILSITIDVVMSGARGGDPVMLTPEVSIGSGAETANQSAAYEIGGKQVAIIPRVKILLSAD